MNDTPGEVLFHHAARQVHVIGDFVHAAPFPPAQVDRELALLGQLAHRPVDFSPAMVQAGQLVERRSLKHEFLQGHAVVDGHPASGVVAVQEIVRNPVQVRFRMAYRIGALCLQHPEAGFLGEVVGVLPAGQARPQVVSQLVYVFGHQR